MMVILYQLLVIATNYNMILKTVLLLSCVALATSSPIGTCPTIATIPTYLPDSVDCAVFYECDNGHPVEFLCAPGTYFNDEKDLCEAPYLVDCGTRSTTTTTATPEAAY
ncbi:unnamed protein product [Diabrotica balteata]|uniref:Chitin-binding type-2 domain-containing protein n=1 Tax=Diabrotica balteata TaxID=107213 RepID=A0A9N9X9G8_DIABA|nr:unnamed protein product [Diabrotica balteata]